jgi:glycolate oxidase FAD binding subunit
MTEPSAMPAAPFATEAEFVPTTQDELRRYLAENASGPRRPIAPVGGRTALDFGRPLAAAAVAVLSSRLDRIVDYPARDMTITVEAGIRMDRLAEALAAEGQRLPIEAPQSNRATLGGVVATDTSGPRRFGYGTMRDYVIGATAITAEGRCFHAGGRVVKNVAGYDLCKLLIGSLGTLAYITQLTLKLKPLPESSVLVVAGFDDSRLLDEAVAGLLTSETRPVAVEALNAPAAAAVATEARSELPRGEWTLLVGYEGSPRETDWQIAKFHSELNAWSPREVRTYPHAHAATDGARLWSALIEFPVCSGEPASFEAQLLPSRLPSLTARASQSGVCLLAHAASGIVIGKLPDEAAGDSRGASLLAELAAETRRLGGHLRLLQRERGWPDAFDQEDAQPGALRLMRALKESLDPADLLNPGRLFKR